MVSQKYHTPFCEKNCNFEHHDLVTVLCLDSSQKSDELPDLLRECIESYQNWDHNGEIPDPLEDLRCPLIYLASAFGKAGLVRALVQDNFNPRALTDNGETALHGAVQYIFLTGSMNTRGLKVASNLGPIKNRMKAFEHILVSLTERDPQIMFVQDNDGNTAFHAAADNIWNDPENDRQGRSAVFFQFCLKRMLTRALELEDAGEMTGGEILETLNAQNSDGDTIFHLLARDYAFGFKSMKFVLNKCFPGQVPSKVNKDNETVANIALERNRKRAMQVFPEFLEQKGDSLITVSSDSESSTTDSPSPSTSRESEEFSTPRDTTVHQEIPLVVISDTIMSQVPHLIVEEENSSSEVIANSQETMTGSVDQEQNMFPLVTNPGTHDLLTVSMDNTLGKASQMEAPSFFGLSQKSTVYDSLVAAPVDAEVMYMTNTVTSVIPGGSNSLAEDGEGCDASFKRLEGLDTANKVTADDQSDPISPFSITFSSGESSAVSATSGQGSSGGEPPSEERVAISSAFRDGGEEDQAVADSIAEAFDSTSDAVQVNSSEASSSTETPTEVLDPSVSDTVESCDAQLLQDDVASFGAQTELFNPTRKQIPEAGEYAQLYAYRMLDTPSTASPYHSKRVYDTAQAHKSTSLTSLASASTETIHSDAFDSSDCNPGNSDDRSTILKCITDNSFLEFLITEGLELNSSSKKGVVDVVMSQYSTKLNHVENAIPKLAAQIRQTETTIDQQTDKVEFLQKELEFVKGEIIKNKSLLEGFIHEQQGLSKHRKALKRKVARCEGTMKQLLGSAKKSRLD